MYSTSELCLKNTIFIFFSTSRRHSQSTTGSSKPPPPPTFLVTNHIQNRNRIHRNSLGIVVGSTSPQSNHRSRSFDGRELSGAPTFFENDESRRHSVSSCTRISGTYYSYISTMFLGVSFRRYWDLAFSKTASILQIWRGNS